MNLPNKLTMVRIILVPLFMAVLLINAIPYNYLFALIIFAAASLTDLLDGKIARSRGMITNLGKFLDPLADKILVMSAFICFIELNLASAVVVMLILFREFSVTSIRLMASSNGEVVAANIWGKLKTVSQIIAICAVLLMQFILQIPQVLQSKDFLACCYAFDLTGTVLIWISAVLAVVSGIIYIWQNRRFIMA